MTRLFGGCIQWRSMISIRTGRRRVWFVTAILMVAFVLTSGCIANADPSRVIQGSWTGVLAKTQVFEADGTPHDATVLEIDGGPEIAFSRGPGVPIVPEKRPLLVRYESQMKLTVISPRNLPLGTRVKVNGWALIRFARLPSEEWEGETFVARQIDPKKPERLVEDHLLVVDERLENLE